MLRKSLTGMSLVFAAAIVLVAGSVADAQQPGRGRGGIGRGGFGGFGGIGKAALLRSEQVKTELKVTDEQSEKVAEVLTAQREAAGPRAGFRGLQDLSAEERRERLTQLREQAQKAAAEMDTKLAAILTSEQNERLEQILVQLQGASALTDAKIQEKLGVSDEQKTKINDVLASQREAMRELREVEREERQAKMEEIRTATETALDNVLSSEQQTRFAELKGEPFELDRRQLFRGGRRGPGGADGDAPRRGRRGARGNNT